VVSRQALPTQLPAPSLSSQPCSGLFLLSVRPSACPPVPHAAGFATFSTGGSGQATSRALFHAARDSASLRK